MIESQIASLLQTVFDEVGRDKMETLVELIQQRRVQDTQTEVKVNGKDVIIPGGKIAQINCKANMILTETDSNDILAKRC